MLLSIKRYALKLLSQNWLSSSARLIPGLVKV